MSDLVTVSESSTLSLDISSALKAAGLSDSVAFVSDGATINEFKIEKLKLDPSRKVRVAFLTNGGIVFQQHYVKGYGNILCNNGECCKRLVDDGDNIQTTKRVLFPVVEYMTADPTRTRLEDIDLTKVSVRVFVTHFKTYNKRMADNFVSCNGPSMASVNDWVLTSTTGQFQGGLESMSPVGPCLWKMKQDVFEYVRDTLNSNLQNLFDAVGEKFNAAKFNKFLADGGFAAVAGGKAPATPVAPSLPQAGEAVNLNAMVENFGL